MRRYREPDADNARWEGFEFRPGDIVVDDAPSKSGTTWTQLLGVLVFEGPVFPEPIGKTSLWIEQCTRPVEEAHAIFSAQTHRRFIKSHTPLDGVPIRDEIRDVCVGGDPRDAAISMIHHGENMDPRRWAELIGEEGHRPLLPTRRGRRRDQPHEADPAGPLRPADRRSRARRPRSLDAQRKPPFPNGLTQPSRHSDLPVGQGIPGSNTR